MVGAGRITGSGSNALIGFLDQLSCREVFIPSISPFLPGNLVKKLGQSFCSLSARALVMMEL